MLMLYSAAVLTIRARFSPNPKPLPSQVAVHSFVSNNLYLIQYILDCIVEIIQYLIYLFMRAKDLNTSAISTF